CGRVPTALPPPAATSLRAPACARSATARQVAPRTAASRPAVPRSGSSCAARSPRVSHACCRKCVPSASGLFGPHVYTSVAAFASAVLLLQVQPDVAVERRLVAQQLLRAGFMCDQAAFDDD